MRILKRLEKYNMLEAKFWCDLYLSFYKAIGSSAGEVITTIPLVW